VLLSAKADAEANNKADEMIAINVFIMVSSI
jgi:hypothetical protein